MKWIILVSLALVALSGCGVETVDAPKVALSHMKVESFPPQNWRLTNNRFFMWREDLSATHVSTALRIADELEELDRKAAPLIRQSLQLESRIDPLKEKARLLSSSFRGYKRIYTANSKKVRALKKDLKTTKETLATTKSNPNATPEEVIVLREKIAAIEAEIAALESQMESMKEVQEEIETEIDTLKGEYEPLEEQLDKVAQQQMEVDRAGQLKVEEIMTVVEWYKDQPSSVVFQFDPDGSIRASISGWNFGDDKGPQNFTTDAPKGRKATIGNVKYTEAGGAFDFEVYRYEDEDQTQLKETFAFHIVRVKYDAEDGRKYFSGEIIRTRPDGSVRKGIAKLIDRNN